MSVVVIDDDFMTLKMARRVLGRDFDVHVAPDFSTGMQLIRRYDPDVVLIDLLLPDAHALDIIPQIKFESAADVVVVTGLWRPGLLDDLWSVGADFFLSKPVTQEQLLQTVAKLVWWDEGPSARRL